MFAKSPSSAFRRRVLLGSVILLCPIFALASGIYTDGATARAKALGGASAAAADGPLDAFAANPAALSRAEKLTLELGAAAAWLHGEFANTANDHTAMSEHGFIPHGAIASAHGPVTFGLAFIPDATLRADWRYEDAPGGLGGLTTYGTHTHKSEIGVLRLAFGASYEITPTLSFGASAGLLYNRNRLEAPYIIQTQPQLAGAKVLLDLETEGWGWNAQFGVLWEPLSHLQLSLSYTLQSRLRSEGRAFAEARRQLADLGVAGVDSTATFEAEVTNTFPHIVTAGLAWQPMKKLGLFAQLDWINWADSFDTLEVRLRNVDNDLYRTLLAGKSNLDDDVPLDWRDQWVLRLGAEYALTEHWSVRAGYRYARNPVPSETMTPLTAAITEHLVSLGVGYQADRWSVDVAWQWQLPSEESTGRSRLLTGEYSGSEVEISAHWLAVTTRFTF
jgi:long-chain fatty acid transport protein